MSEIGPLQRARELEQLNRSLRDANDELAATNARLERETAAKDQFLAALSHELRNPLAAIQGAVDLLQDTGDGHADEQQLMLDVVDRQVQALKQITDDVLDMIRARVGKLRLSRDRLDLGVVVDDAVRAAATGRELERRTLATDLPDDDIWVDGDAIRLSQAIGNLLTNAIKFTGPEGVIAVALRSDGHAAQIQVRDDGRGFDRAHAAELFEPFAQGDTSLARTISGLGLGLPIVREIVGLHGGRVSAHSDGPGTGASFVIELPLFTEV